MTNNKQQSAVEWLIEHYTFADLTADSWQMIQQQAKEMEKEQHATTWDKSMDNLDARGGNIVRAWVDFDEYYNETYGGNK
jgi:hypothetical protein